LASITTFTAPSATPAIDPVPQRQRLVVVPGQYFSDGTDDAAGVGVQRLYDRVNVQVLYSTGSDVTPPELSQVDSSLNGTSIQFSTVVSDGTGVQRVMVLYATGAGNWSSLDLTQGAGGRWSGTGTVPAGTTTSEFIVQAVDTAGNVGVSASKGRLFDAEPPVRISGGSAGVNEGAAGATTVDVPVTLNHASSHAVSVSYATVGGTADAPSDYASTAGRLSFAPGQTTRTIPVEVVGDQLLEPSETVTIRLTDPSDATIADDTATLTITNDDADQAPVAHAGDDKTVGRKRAFGLNGSASQDPDGQPLTYHWEQIEGPTVVLTDADRVKAKVAGNRPKAVLRFRLTVTDPTGHSSSDTITVNPK
jgi:hypothetical protein